MDVTYALYELRDVLEKDRTVQLYNQACYEAEEDSQLQILFGEFERCKEVYTYCSDDEKKKNIQRAQQLKEKIFAKETYRNLQLCEKQVNQLRQTVAQQLFSVLDENIEIAGIRKQAGGCRCGS